MSDQQKSYRQIMKATSLFGGLQVFQIIISVIRSKFVAVLLGPAGMGVVGLLYTTTVFITALTDFGLGRSAVKNISEANATQNEQRVATVITVLRKMIWVTGMLGTIMVLVLSPWLSQITFGNKSYTSAFAWISIILLFNQLSGGQIVLLQGLRKLQHLAKATLYGSIVGLFITVPLYYKFGVDGIVPVIILTSIASLFFSWFYARKVKIKSVKVSKQTAILEAKDMLTMGFAISISGLISIGVAYLLRIFISRTGNLSDVGLYTAGFTIIGTYVGMVFTAMGTDYYPRLAAVAHDNELCKENINQQAEIALLLLAPILIGFLVFINWGIILLYSTQFVAVTGMVYWAALGMFFKAGSWSINFVFLAKGASKLYFWNELAGNSYTLLFNILGYHFYGLTGLGISFLITFIIYFIQVYIIARMKYNFAFNKSYVKLFIIQFSLILISFVAVQILPQPYPYVVGTLLIALSGWYSVKELEDRIALKQLIRDFIDKRKNKDDNSIK